MSRLEFKIEGKIWLGLSRENDTQKHRRVSYYERSLQTLVGFRWHREVVKTVGSLMPDIDVGTHLDIGCNDGVRARMIRPEGKIVGIDIDREALGFASERGIDTQLMSADHLAFQDEKFDLVTMIECLEHLNDPSSALREASRVLKEGGFLIAVVPNETLLFEVIWWLWTRLGLGVYWRGKHLFKYSLWGIKGDRPSLIDMLLGASLMPRKTASCNLNMIIGVRAAKSQEI